MVRSKNTHSAREQHAHRRLRPGRALRITVFSLLWGVLLLAFFPQLFLRILGPFFSSSSEEVPQDSVALFLQTIETKPVQPAVSLEVFHSAALEELDRIDTVLSELPQTDFSSQLEYVDFAAEDRQARALSRGSGPGIEDFLYNEYQKVQTDLRRLFGGRSLPSLPRSLGGGGMHRIYGRRPQGKMFYGKGRRKGMNSNDVFNASPWIEEYAQSDRYTAVFDKAVGRPDLTRSIAAKSRFE